MGIGEGFLSNEYGFRDNDEPDIFDKIFEGSHETGLFEEFFIDGLGDYSLHNNGSEGSIEFMGNKGITQTVLFRAFTENDTKDILGRKDNISNGITLYDSVNNALLVKGKELEREGLRKNIRVLAFTIDTRNLLDLLDIVHIGKICKWYKYDIENKLIDNQRLKNNADREVIRSFYKHNKESGKNNFNIVRRLIDNRNPIYKNSIISSKMYLEYTILDTSTIKNIEIYK